MSAKFFRFQLADQDKFPCHRAAIPGDLYNDVYKTQGPKTISSHTIAPPPKDVLICDFFFSNSGFQMKLQDRKYIFQGLPNSNRSLLSSNNNSFRVVMSL